MLISPWVVWQGSRTVNSKKRPRTRDYYPLWSLKIVIVCESRKRQPVYRPQVSQGLPHSRPSAALPSRYLGAGGGGEGEEQAGGVGRRDDSELSFSLGNSGTLRFLVSFIFPCIVSRAFFGPWISYVLHWHNSSLTPYSCFYWALLLFLFFCPWLLCHVITDLFY